MKRSVLAKYALPFIQWFGLMIVTAIVLDYILHRLDLLFIGYYLSYPGTFLIIVSFVYSLRKRKIINIGSPKKLLTLHEYLAWIGSILLLIHAGIHFNAILPWLAIVMMIVSVGSGLTGKFLLKKATDTLKQKKKVLRDSGLTADESEKQLFFDSITVDLMRKWRIVHLPITILFALFAVIHIITIIIFIK